MNDVIDTHIVRSAEFFRECNIGYGYIYIDGNHSYEGCRFDLDESLKFVTQGALIAMHDVLVSDEPYGVCKAFAELDRELYDTLIIPVWPGIGIIRRKTPK